MNIATLAFYPKVTIFSGDRRCILSITEAARIPGARLGNLAYECDGTDRPITEAERADFEKLADEWKKQK